MNKSVLVILLSLVCSCSNYGQLTFVTKLPKKLNENSGMVYTAASNLWFIEDSGNADNIYQVDLKGNLLKKLEIKGGKNKDWEDLTQDENGNVYIGDFGNNRNDRQDLVIYKIPNPDLEKGQEIKAEKIKFSYPEQQKFPPKKNGLLYDAEAFFHANDSLYIITRNRSHPFSGKALVYKLPAKKGTYKATLVDTLTLCDDRKKCQVTSATIAPDKKTVILLGYGNLWIFRDFKGSDFTKGKMQTIDLETSSQLESIIFKTKDTLLLSDEQTKIYGRNLYSYTLD